MQELEMSLETVVPLRIRQRTSTPRLMVVNPTIAAPRRKGEQRLPNPWETRSPASSSTHNSRQRSPALDQVSPPGELTIVTTVHICTPSGKIVRRLPAIPSSPSSPSPGPCSPRTFRPLPSPPTSSPLSTTSTASRSCSNPSPTMIPVITQSQVVRPRTPPSHPSTPSTSSNFINETPIAPDIVESPEQSPPKPLARPLLPTLLTSSDFLKPPPSSETVSLNSPGSPQPPTPQTAKRKRMAKLRRYLGEPILDEAVYARNIEISRTTEKTLEEVQKLEGSIPYLRAAIAVGKILDMASDDDSSSEEGPEEVEKDRTKREDYSWVLEDGVAFRTSTTRRYSRKWVNEKKGHRWEEPNYNRIIQALRAL